MSLNIDFLLTARPRTRNMVCFARPDRWIDHLVGELERHSFAKKAKFGNKTCKSGIFVTTPRPPKIPPTADMGSSSLGAVLTTSCQHGNWCKTKPPGPVKLYTVEYCNVFGIKEKPCRQKEKPCSYILIQFHIRLHPTRHK
jgi:hypothetical protein